MVTHLALVKADEWIALALLFVGVVAKVAYDVGFHAGRRAARTYQRYVERPRTPSDHHRLP